MDNPRGDGYAIWHGLYQEPINPAVERQRRHAYNQLRITYVEKNIQNDHPGCHFDGV